MDLSAIKQKLASQQDSGQKREKIDYEATFWKPTTGKHQIRIVPSMFNPEMPFSELYFHYGIGKYPMIALTNFGEQDPVVDFVNELRKTSDRDNWSLSGKLAPKMRVHAPVVVRGEEDKGVRLWGFGKQVYNTLLQLAADEDIGDFTDIINGFDIVVEVVQGNPYPQTSVRVKPKQTPLSDDNTQVETWTKTQPDPLKSFSKYDFDFIKRQLEGWLNGDENGGSATQAAQPVTAAPAATQAPANNFTVANQAPAADTVSKFDDLFGDSSNDLPF